MFTKAENAMSRSMEQTPIILFSSVLFCVLITTSTAVDTLTANQTLRDGKTIKSAGGIFELGFFSPGTKKNRYLGIWYKKVSTGTVVWVANRKTPITNFSGMLSINKQGNLVLKDGANSIIWSSNFSTSVTNPVGQLLDNGNFVLRYDYDTNSENFLWQSFDYPGDHILPGMKFGWDMERGLDRSLTSWKSPDDPSPGNFTNGVNPSGYPQLFLWKGPMILFRSCPWDGIQFSGLSFPIPDLSFELEFVFNPKEIYYRYELINSLIIMRLVLHPNGNINLLHWIDHTKSWESYLTAERDECEHYAFCGANGICNITKNKLGYDPCGCLRGFEPKFPQKGKLADRSGGCVRRLQLVCESGDVFVKHSNLKLPDTQHSWLDPSMNLEECERRCLKNCSCTAYSNIDIRGGGTGCLLWFHDLIDIRDNSYKGLDLYVRVAASELEGNRSSRAKRNMMSIAVAISVVLTVVVSVFLILVFKKKKLKRKLGIKVSLTRRQEADDTNELLLFDFEKIATATNNFSQNNKLGEGGFGPVYKGILDEGQEIAVKRLSKTSKQGLDEYKNEVSCIAKLQHRNLVRLLGCCIEEEEMLLIYEYMPNKSLDSFIFDKKLSKLLDWSKRYNIINGIAKGLLYLHQDSRLRIIHRDLKPSNILLDCDMNPRISDFGMARSFAATEVAVNTRKVVGTYGYMSPEYAIDGLFSIKSDVYSFGVVVLEIVTGEKISSFYCPDQNLNLLGYVWKLYNEGKFLELIDGKIVESCKQSELLRAIHIGLLCVQPYPGERPNMSLVVQMLGNETELPQPKLPGFYTEKNLQEANSSKKLSNDQLTTVTFYAPR